MSPADWNGKMELYAFFVWPALVFGALIAYAWYARSQIGKRHRRPGQ